MGQCKKKYSNNPTHVTARAAISSQISHNAEPMPQEIPPPASDQQPHLKWAQTGSNRPQSRKKAAGVPSGGTKYSV
jgi:hypothetical protein